MPVPSLITDLSTTAASNFPAGSDAPSTIDDVLRAHAAFIAQLYSGAAAGYGAANRVPYYNATTTQTSSASFQFDGTGLGLGGANSGTNKLTVTGSLGAAAVDSTGANLTFSRADANYIDASNAAGFLVLRTGSSTERLRINAAGDLIANVNTSAPSLTTNRTMTFELTSDTSLKIVVRGSDGNTRSASLVLA
jgi:hypothetical protein